MFPLRKSVEALPCLLENGVAACYRLPTLDGQVDIGRVDLERFAAPARPFGGQQRRAAACECIHNDVADGRDVEDRIRKHADRLDRGMRREVVFGITLAAGGAGVLPNIAPVQSELAQPHIVARAGVLVHGHIDKFMPRAVEPAHAADRLYPDTEVDLPIARHRQRRIEFPHVPPVHEDKGGCIGR